MKFAKYDKDNFQLKISKQEAKELFEILDNMYISAENFDYPNKTFWDFMNGLKNLSSSSDSN